MSATNPNFDASSDTARLYIAGSVTGMTKVHLMDYTSEVASELDATKDWIGHNYIVAKHDSDDSFLLANEGADDLDIGFQALTNVNMKANATAYGQGALGSSYDMWQVQTVYTMTFDKNGGDTEAEPSAIAAEYQEEKFFGVVIQEEGYFVKSLPTVEPTRVGAHFLEWNYAADGSGGKVTLPSGGIEIERDTTVYAIWGATVKFNPNYDGAPEGWADDKDVSLRFGATGVSLAETQIPEPPEREGYTFEGWYSAQDGTGNKLTTSTVIDSDATYYAKWSQEEPKEQLWYYEVYYEYIDEDGTSTWTLYKDGQGGWALPTETVGISHDSFDGTDLGWGSVDGSGNEILGTHYVYDATYPTGETGHRLSATCAEAAKDNPLKIYYRATPHTVTYEFEGEAPSYVKLPAQLSTCYSAPITVANEPTAFGWTFKGWTSDDVTIARDGTFTMPNKDVTITGTWERTATALKPTATSLVAYEGGEGSSANPEDALPEPVWRYESEGWNLYIDGVEQPKGMDAFNWAYFSVDDNYEQTEAASTGVYELRAWALDGNHEVTAKDAAGNVYRLDLGTEPESVLDGKNDPVTVSVRDVVSDESAEHLTSDALKPVYGQASDAIEGVELLADEGSALEGNYGSNGLLQDECSVEEPHAHMSEDAVLYKNGVDSMPLEDGAKIGLLWDNLLSNVLGAEDQIAKLEEKALAAASMGTPDGSEFKYIDLVDMADGNVWVGTAGENAAATTVFWPYPEGVDKNDEIAVVRFTGLTRDYTVNADDEALNNAVEASRAVNLEITKTDEGVLFEIPSQGFGPIEMLWVDGEEDPDPDSDPDPDPTPDPNPDPEPDPDPDPDPTPDPDPDPEPEPEPGPEPDPDSDDKPKPGKPGLPATGDPALAVTLVTAGAGAVAIAAAAVVRKRR